MKIKKIVPIGICLSLLTGCWDQNLMKNAVLIQTITFDHSDEGELLIGISIPKLNRALTDSGQEKIGSETLSTVANTPREGRMKLNTEIPGNLDSSKNKLILFGEQFAKGDIYPPLDVLWRDPRSSLSAKLVVMKGQALEALSITPKTEPNISQNILNLIRSTETSTVIPKQSIQTLASEILDPGEDFVLPLLSLGQKGKTVDVAGLALFDERKMSGDLSSKESPLFLLLNNKKGKHARFTKRVNENEEMEMTNFISLNVDHMKRKLNVSVKGGGEVYANLNLQLKVLVEEYPKGNVPKELEQLNKKLSRIFTDDAEEIIRKLQEANCDAFGIGRHLIAFHHADWKEIDKETYFQDVVFKTKVDVEIIQHGIVK